MDHWYEMRKLLGDHTVMRRRVLDPDEADAEELEKYILEPVYERCPCGFIYAASKD